MIERHSFMARMFHWVMAASMFVLLFTAFLPIVGVRFAWVEWHWMAGLVLTGSIIYHIIHATFFLDFWSIWIGPKDIPEFKAEMMRELRSAMCRARSPASIRSATVSITSRSSSSASSASISGMIMMSRVRQPLFTRNPYVFADTTWGLTYVLHGVCRCRARRPGDRARVLRGPSGEVVDYQER